MPRRPRQAMGGLAYHVLNRAEDWRWCSLWRRQRPADERRFLLMPSDWPVSPPRNWTTVVNRPENEEELEALRQCVKRGAPFGDADWQGRTATKLGLESSLRPRGRPKHERTTEPTTPAPFFRCDPFSVASGTLLMAEVASE